MVSLVDLAIMAEQNNTRKSYPSDMANAEWQRIEPLIPKPKSNRGRDDVKNNIDEWDLMIPLVGDYDSYVPKCYIQSNPEADDLLPAELTEPYIPAILSIDWPDFGVPFISAIWWKGLVRFLETYDGDVVFFCQGGHGRTGTALTILACLSQEELRTGIECPLFWLRDNYCEHAVETYDQVDYIEKITDMQIWSQPYYEGYGIHHVEAKSYTSYPAKAGKKI